MRTTLALTYLLGDVLQCTSRLSEKASNIYLFGCGDKSHWCQICNNNLPLWEQYEILNLTAWTWGGRKLRHNKMDSDLPRYMITKTDDIEKKKLTHTIVSYTPPMTLASFHERLGYVRGLWNDEGSGHKVTSPCAFPKDIRYDQLGSTARNFGSYTVWTECSTANISPWQASHCPWSQSDGGARKTKSLAMNSQPG